MASNGTKKWHREGDSFENLVDQNVGHRDRSPLRRTPIRDRFFSDRKSSTRYQYHHDRSPRGQRDIEPFDSMHGPDHARREHARRAFDTDNTRRSHSGGKFSGKNSSGKRSGAKSRRPGKSSKKTPKSRPLEFPSWNDMGNDTFQNCGAKLEASSKDNNCDRRFAADMEPENLPGPSKTPEASDVAPNSLAEHNAVLRSNLAVANEIIEEKDAEINALRSRVLNLEASEKHLIKENTRLRDSECDKEVSIRLAKRRFENMKQVKAQIPWKNAAGVVLNNFRAVMKISEALIVDMGTELGRAEEFENAVKNCDDRFLMLNNGRKVKVSHLHEWAADKRRGDRVVKYDTDEKFAWFKIKSQGDTDEDFIPLKVDVEDEVFDKLSPKEEVPSIDLGEALGDTHDMVVLKNNKKAAPEAKKAPGGDETKE